MKYKIICLIIMILATYIPRSIPLLFCRKPIKSIFIQSFLYYMPYSVLAALTFPSIFFSTGNTITATIGTIIALIMSLFEINLAIVATVCVAIVFGLSFII